MTLPYFDKPATQLYADIQREMRRYFEVTGIKPNVIGENHVHELLSGMLVFGGMIGLVLIMVLPGLLMRAASGWR